MCFLGHWQVIEEIADQGFRIDSGDVNAPLSGTDRPSKWRMSKAGVDLSNIISLPDLTGIRRTPHPTTAEDPAVHREHSPRQTTFQTRTHTLTNLKEHKSCEVCSQATVELN